MAGRVAGQPFCERGASGMLLGLHKKHQAKLDEPNHRRGRPSGLLRRLV